MGYRSTPLTDMEHREALTGDDRLCDHAQHERADTIYDQGFDYQGENVVPEHQEPATFEQFT